MTDLTGREAAKAGLPLSACPHSPGSDEGRVWCRQWAKATSEERQLSGEFGVTFEQKAAAGLPEVPTQFGSGLVLVRPLVVDDVTAEALEAMRAEFERVAATFEHFADQMMDLFDASFGPDTMTLRGFTVEEETDPKARALERKRRPFTCHRHGVQPGGFCRSCSRGSNREVRR